MSHTLSSNKKFFSKDYLSNGYKAIKYKIFNFLFRRKKYYCGFNYLKDKKLKKRVLISYLYKPFVCNNKHYINSHQNKWQALEIARIFNRLGYMVDIFQFNDLSLEPKRYKNYDILFGVGVNFKRFASKINPGSLKIYYATGMHWKQREDAEKKRLKLLEMRKGVRLKNVRKCSFSEEGAVELADVIILTGDEYTKKSYRDFTKDKPIYSIRISSFPFLKINKQKNNFKKTRKNFLWFGSMGFVLKGLDLLLDVFKECPDSNLFICGKLREKEGLKRIYKDELYNTSNIYFLGFTPVISKQFHEVIEKCAYVIMPSASEGIPGGVVACILLPINKSTILS